MGNYLNPHKWRIYYDDGSTFDSVSGQSDQAPPDGVIVIVCYENGVGRQLLQGWDWYVYRRTEGWYGCDLHGLLDNLKNYPLEFSAVKQGRTVHTARFKEIIARADAEMGGSA